MSMYENSLVTLLKEIYENGLCPLLNAGGSRDRVSAVLAPWLFASANARNLPQDKADCHQLRTTNKDPLLLS